MRSGRAVTYTLRGCALSLIVVACDVPQPIEPFIGPQEFVLPVENETVCDYQAVHDLGFHTIYSTNCAVPFDNDLKTYRVDYTFTRGAEAGQRTAYAVVEWRGMNSGITGYALRHIEWHDDSSSMGSTSHFAIKFPSQIDGVAITGYSVLCAATISDPIECWNNRDAAHNDARWLISRTGTDWQEAVDNVWGNLESPDNAETRSPVLDDLIVVCDPGAGSCSLDGRHVTNVTGPVSKCEFLQSLELCHSEPAIYEWRWSYASGASNVYALTAEPYYVVSDSAITVWLVFQVNGIWEGVTASIAGAG